MPWSYSEPEVPPDFYVWLQKGPKQCCGVSMLIVLIVLVKIVNTVTSHHHLASILSETNIRISQVLGTLLEALVTTN